MMWSSSLILGASRRPSLNYSIVLAVMIHSVVIIVITTSNKAGLKLGGLPLYWSLSLSLSRSLSLCCCKCVGTPAHAKVGRSNPISSNGRQLGCRSSSHCDVIQGNCVYPHVHSSCHEIRLSSEYLSGVGL